MTYDNTHTYFLSQHKAHRSFCLVGLSPNMSTCRLYLTQHARSFVFYTVIGILPPYLCKLCVLVTREDMSKIICNQPQNTFKREPCGYSLRCRVSLQHIVTSGGVINKVTKSINPFLPSVRIYSHWSNSFGGGTTWIGRMCLIQQRCLHQISYKHKFSIAGYW